MRSSSVNGDTVLARDQMAGAKFMGIIAEQCRGGVEAVPLFPNALAAFASKKTDGFVFAGFEQYLGKAGDGCTTRTARTQFYLNDIARTRAIELQAGRRSRNDDWIPAQISPFKSREPARLGDRQWG
jgi:hypothetical protein